MNRSLRAYKKANKKTTDVRKKGITPETGMQERKRKPERKGEKTPKERNRT